MRLWRSSSSRLESSASINANTSAISDEICQQIKNDYSFPAACTSHEIAPRGAGSHGHLWYTGVNRYLEEMMAENGTVGRGMMFVGDKERSWAASAEYAVNSRSETPTERRTTARTPRQRGRRRSAGDTRQRMPHGSRRSGRRPGTAISGSPDLRCSQPGLPLPALGGRRVLAKDSAAARSRIPEANKF